MLRSLMVMFMHLLILGNCFSQDSVHRGLRFQTALHAGILVGQAGNALQLHAVNGVKFKTNFAGIGVGLDYYRVRSIPLFVDLRKEILLRNQTPFVYSSIGIHFPWPRQAFDWSPEYRSGLFYDLGIGYRFNTGQNAITVSTGYSFKKYNYQTTEAVPCFNPPCPETTHYFEEKLRRLSLKAGFIF